MGGKPLRVGGAYGVGVLRTPRLGWELVGNGRMV